MQSGGRLSASDTQLLGRIINFVETAAMEKKRNTGDTMSAMEVVTLLTNRVRSGHAFPDTAGYMQDRDAEHTEPVTEAHTLKAV